ncbi:hypothetical protein Aeqsu_0211 [Aequorivita sublithincola DSM 14238]|uniref:Cytochrome c domain-containing protein n=1 Tax=Aequorivita sublithincola (strain DSM 14238 / LMG 21431 / ACAM 643 / 9-3) TaxID=746697 RepID=I3YRW6_AEQSU|nr:c-type cytochrome [Aequorivita sublithincola]AFL79734.1 hypothetical protein Aeqsu_0211 [Aequorivita sublithincola DSM 14238]
MRFLATLFFIILLAACNNQNHSSYLTITEKNESVEFKLSQEHPGKKLMENNCYACHNPKSTEEEMMAPPMIAVKMNYISEDTSKEDFVAEIIEWTKNPSSEKSKMPEEVKKFGLMPYQFYPENTIRQIADYMYDNEIE